MAFDVLVARAVALELKTLAGARVDRVSQMENEDVGLSFYGPGGKAVLYFSANAANARLHLATSLPSPVTGVSPFTLILRRHLEGSQLRDVTVPPLERVITLCFQAPPIRGRRTYRLVAEIMGRHSNLILVDPDSDLIIDGLKRYSHAVSRYREVLPGQPYLPPPPGQKEDPLAVGEEDLARVLLAGGLERPLEKALIQSFNGFGPQLAREVVARAGLDPDLPLEFCGYHELTRLWQSWSEIMDAVRNDRFRPTLVRYRHRVVAYGAIELKQYQSVEQEFLPSMSQVVEKYYREQSVREKWEREKSRLEAILTDRHKRWLKKVNLQREALAEAEECERYRLAGEIITANIHRLAPGARFLEATNPYNPEETVRLELDPSLTPAQNAQRQFKRYRKLRTQAEQAGLQLAQAEAELAYVESVQESLDRTETLEDLAEIGQELDGRPRTPGKPRRSPPQPQAPSLLKLTSPDGYVVLVGRNNRQNDHLVVHLAGPEDIWLHARGVPGAHVLIRNSGADPVPRATLEYAAGLAAYHSKARLSHSVPVDYTSAKHVHKPKGAKPGMVYYTHQKTIAVPPLPPD